jgi:hypothetical protein
MVTRLNMRRKWIFLGPLASLGIALVIFIGGEIVMHLWNWNLPPLFGWHEITFWQALGLFALCRILFGGSGPLRPGSARVRRRLSEGISEQIEDRCLHMTAEERDRFRQRMRERWGFGPAADEGPGK